MKSYHSHEVFNFRLFHPKLPLLLDLVSGEQAASEVRLKDGAPHQDAHSLHIIHVSFEKLEEVDVGHVGHVGLVQQLQVFLLLPSDSPPLELAKEPMWRRGVARDGWVG